jgi:predicted GNAT family acetyltransferase
MADIHIRLNEKAHGAFYIAEAGKQLGEMVIGIAGKTLTVYHTEILPEEEGKGYGRQLLNAMVAYAREHQLQVMPLCPYVHAQFKRHPESYADIWQPDVAAE